MNNEQKQTIESQKGSETDRNKELEVSGAGEGKEREWRDTNLLEEFDPFARRDALLRSPPRIRTYSLPDIDMSSRQTYRQKEPLAINQPLKRKRVDQSFGNERLIGEGGEMHKYIISNLLEKINELNSVVQDMYKPKQEIKDIASKLAYYAQQLQSNDQEKWLQSVLKTDEKLESHHTWTEERGLLKAQIDKLKAQCAVNNAACQECKRRKYNRGGMHMGCPRRF
ncbi:hypothetical protein QE152_g6482 [Popillia japonica]|uniref:Uncharacterized protein n=1 Tax=Popillia japonica TaxID=7064 RepID=A0AAW1MHV4_POPJA